MTAELERTFTVEGVTESVDDIMIGIPRMFRDEFVGSKFDSYKSLSLCLAHADIAQAAYFDRKNAWKYEKEIKAMREYLK
jgi:hypothetical protein